MDKFNIEAKAFNYYNVIEGCKKEGKKTENCLSPELWVKYIQMSNDLTSNRVIVKKCVRCLIRAHGFLSDYFKEKL